MFMGLEGITEGDPADLFEHLPEIRPVAFDGTAPDLKQVRRSRKLQSPSIFGQGVLEICQAADVVFMALHGANGEDGRVQAAFDLLGIPYTGSGYLGAGIVWSRPPAAVLPWAYISSGKRMPWSRRSEPVWIMTTSC